MVESQSLQLTQQTSDLNSIVVKYVTQSLVKKGHTAITPTLLLFLSAMECGINHGSDIARKIGVSRQMVAKIVKELCQLGYLRQIDGSGKQKDILFTTEGEHLIADARQLLYELDSKLSQQLGTDNLSNMIKQLTDTTNLIREMLTD